MSLMDELERRRFLNTLRSDDEFRATVRRELLTQELLDLPQAVAELHQTVSALVDVVAAQAQTLAEHGQTLAEHGQTLATLVDVAAGQRQDFVALATDVRDYMGRAITLIGDGFSAVDAKITDLRSAMEAGFTAVDARFTQVDAKFDQVDARFTQVDAKFDQIDADLRLIKDQLAS